MKHFHCLQGSADWLRLRLGKPTASAFDKLITAKKWEPTKSDTRRNYAIYLLTELILDAPLSGVTTATLAHGHTTEEKARAAYEALIGKEVDLCGFITNDAQTYGASPDALVGDDGSVEIKSPFKPEIHVEYMMRPESFVEEYFVQTQGQLFVSGRQWTDLISYFSILPMVQVRIVPNPVFQEKLAAAVHSFCAEFSDLVRRAVDLGYLKETPNTTDWIEAGDVDMVKRGRQQPTPAGDFDLTDDDVARIWAASQKRQTQEPNGNGAKAGE